MWGTHHLCFPNQACCGKVEPYIPAEQPVELYKWYKQPAILFLRKLDYVTFSCFLQVKSKLMMMTCFCGVADWQKAFGLISSWDHCQRSWPSWIFDMLQARFEPVQKSSGFVEWSCTVNSMKEKGFKWLYNFISPQLL